MAVFNTRDEHTQADRDRLLHVPRMPANLVGKFHQYAGYVQVDEKANRNFFYWFVESQRDPAHDPLVVWKNGGPGCSSLIGLLTENGPFFAGPNRTLIENPNSWNRIANVVYVESPAGVGFSYSDDPRDVEMSDARASADTYVFLQKFLERFPAQAKNELYLAGESWAGHYLIDDAITIVRNNAKNEQPIINLRGILNGNPYTDTSVDDLAVNEALWDFGLISNDTRYLLDTACAPTGMPNPRCENATEVASREFGPLDYYAVFRDFCPSLYEDRRHQFLRMTATARPASVYAALYRAQQRSRQQQLQARASGPMRAAACVDNYATEYLNGRDIWGILNVFRRKSLADSFVWRECTSERSLKWEYSDFVREMSQFYPELLAAKLRILIYAGDTDMIVPFCGTRRWIDKLGLTPDTPFRPWMFTSPSNPAAGPQVGGRFMTFKEGLTVTTLRGAGHMAPSTEPERAFQMFQRFLRGQSLADETPKRS